MSINIKQVAVFVLVALGAYFAWTKFIAPRV